MAGKKVAPPHGGGRATLLTTTASASSGSAQPFAKSPGRPSRRGAEQPVSAALAKQKFSARLAVFAGGLTGYALLGVILLVLALPPLALLGLGILAIAVALFSLIGIVLALCAVLGGNVGDLVATLNDLAQLDAAVRVGLLCASFYGLLFALSALLGGVLGPRKLRFYMAPGALATLPALLLFLGAVVFVAPVATSAGLTAPWQMALAIYALLDVVILAVVLADTRPPAPRRRGHVRRRAARQKQSRRRQAQPTAAPALAAPHDPPPNFSLQPTAMVAFTLPPTPSSVATPARQPIGQSEARPETPVVLQSIVMPEASQPHISAFVVTRRDLERESAPTEETPTLPKPSAVHAPVSAPPLPGTITPFTLAPVSQPMPNPSSDSTEQPTQETPAIERHDVAQIPTAIIPVLSPAPRQDQQV